MTSAVVRVERHTATLTWRAGADGETVGEVRAVLRPDERCIVRFDSCRADTYEPLLAAVARELERDVYVTVDEADRETQRFYEALGFVFNRRESHYLIPTDPEATGLSGVAVPSSFVVDAADQVDLDRLRQLDDTLRQDVPGTDGWRWDEERFHEEFVSPSFDPATYLIAVEKVSGAYVGIVRVWINPEGPRLGFVGVLPSYRRRGLARALLARVFRVLHERGEAQVSTEIDDENAPSRALLEPLGARRMGGSIELIRR